MEYINTKNWTDDEFNNMTLANCTAYILRKKSLESTVICNNNFNAIYSYAHQTTDVIKDDTAYIDHIGVLEKYMNFQNTHLYKTNFCTMTKIILEEGNNYRFATYNSPYPEHPYIVVHGRNLPKHSFRNYNFFTIIEYIIKLGYTVYNTTFYSPHLKFKEKYYENDYINNYNEQISLMNHANVVFAIACSSGINVHATVKCNLVAFFPDTENWINNTDFGYANESLLSARAKISTVHTDILTSLDQIKEFCKFDPPKI